MSKYIVPLLALASAAHAVSLADVKHVILVMFENRSFNHVSVDGQRCTQYCLLIEVHILTFYSISALSPVFEVLPTPM